MTTALLAGIDLASAQTAPVATASKAQWVRQMETTTPVYLCQKNSPWRMCYSVSAQQCEEDMASSTRVCVGNVDSKIPEVINQSQGQALGGEVGECVTSAFAILHEKDERNTDGCRAAIAKLQKEIPETLPGIQQNAPALSDQGYDRVSGTTRPNDELYTLVDQNELSQYWNLMAKAAEEPNYPTALRSGSGSIFCVAVGYAIGKNGITSNVQTLHIEADGMSGGLQEKLRSGSETYVKGLRFSPGARNSAALPVFTYTVFGRYRYMHGANDSRKKQSEARALQPCEQAAKAAMAKLRSRSQ